MTNQIDRDAHKQPKNVDFHIAETFGSMKFGNSVVCTCSMCAIQFVFGHVPSLNSWATRRLHVGRFYFGEPFSLLEAWGETGRAGRPICRGKLSNFGDTAKLRLRTVVSEIQPNQKQSIASVRTETPDQMRNVPSSFTRVLRLSASALEANVRSVVDLVQTKLSALEKE